MQIPPSAATSEGDPVAERSTESDTEELTASSLGGIRPTANGSYAGNDTGCK